MLRDSTGRITRRQPAQRRRPPAGQPACLSPGRGQNKRPAVSPGKPTCGAIEKRKGKKIFSSTQIHEKKKKEKKENIPNGSISRVHVWSPKSTISTLEMACEAYYLESYNYKFLGLSARHRT